MVLFWVKCLGCGCVRWLEHYSDEKNAALIRSKSYVGACRAILRALKRNSWLGEHRTDVASRAEIKDCVTQHTQVSLAPWITYLPLDFTGNTCSI